MGTETHVTLLELSAGVENNGNNHRKPLETTAHYLHQWGYNIKMEKKGSTHKQNPIALTKYHKEILLHQHSKSTKSTYLKQSEN